MSTRITRTSPAAPIALLAAALLALFGMFTAVPAQAHDQLESTNPKDGAVLAKQPDYLTLTFNDKVQSTGTEIKVMQGDKDVSAGEVTVKGPKVMSALPDDLAAGKYNVVWRVVSADGHPVSGEFSFTIKDGNGAGGAVSGSGAAGTDEASGAPGLGAVSGGAVDQNTQETSSGVSAPVIVLIAVGVIAVVAIVVLLFWRKSKGLGNVSK